MVACWLVALSVTVTVTLALSWVPVHVPTRPLNSKLVSTNASEPSRALTGALEDVGVVRRLTRNPRVADGRRVVVREIGPVGRRAAGPVAVWVTPRLMPKIWAGGGFWQFEVHVVESVYTDTVARQTPASQLPVQHVAPAAVQELPVLRQAPPVEQTPPTQVLPPQQLAELVQA